MATALTEASLTTEVRRRPGQAYHILSEKASLARRTVLLTTTGTGIQARLQEGGMLDCSPQSSTGKTELLSDKVPGTEEATEPCRNCQSIHRIREERAHPSGKQLLTFWPLGRAGRGLPLQLLLPPGL